MVKINKQIKKLSEVEKLRIRMDYRFSQVDETLQELKENDKKIDRVLDQLDSIVGQFKKFDEEQIMQSGRIATHSYDIKQLQRAVFAGA